MSLNDHLSRPDVATRFKRPTRKPAGRRMLSVRSCFEWGLHSPSCYHDDGSLLHCLSTLAAAYATVVYFCCTSLGVTSTGRYPASCPVKPGLSSPAVFRHLQPRSFVSPKHLPFYHKSDFKATATDKFSKK